ncbi:hypothetical protein GCM10028819_29710 [Spirosoma humi]
MATDYFNLGQVCEELKEYKLAEQYIKKALALANAMGNKDKAAIYTQGLADLYGGMNNFSAGVCFSACPKSGDRLFDGHSHNGGSAAAGGQIPGREKGSTH